MTKNFKKSLKRSWPYFIFILPALIWIFVFDLYPVYGNVIAFKDYRVSKGIMGSEWVGFKHFIRLFKLPDLWVMIKNTLRINIISLCSFPIPIILALFLNEVGSKYKKTVQMVSYIPHFLTEVVVCSLVILFLDKQYGVINNIIEFLGGERFYFMGSAEAFPWIYVLSGVWQDLGWGTILYMSALSAVSPEHIDAAKIDGASRLQVTRYVNFPVLVPIISMNFIMRIGRLFGVGFSKVLLLQNDLNLETSRVLSMYTYEMGLLGGQFSYSTAIGLVNTAINLSLLLIVNKIVGKTTGNSLF